MKLAALVCALLLAQLQLHSVVAETQATQATQSVQKTQNTQNAQNSQLFGLPPLPIVLAAAGSFLASHNSPIRINTRVVADKPETKDDTLQITTAAGSGDAPAAAAASADQPGQQQQQMVYGDATVTAQLTPGKGASLTVDGTQQYVQYVAASQAPAGALVWMPVPAASASDSNLVQAPADGANAVTLSGPPQVISGDGTTVALQVPSPPQYLPGTVVSSTIVPGTTTTMVPGQQSFIAVRNFTLNGTQDGNGTEFIQGTSMVSVPITQSQPQVQQQVQQVWVPVQQPPQVLQAYYPAAPRVVQGTKVISTTVTPIAPPSQPGMVIKGGFGWGKMAKPQQGRVWGGQGFGGQGFGGQGFVGMKAAGGVVMQPAAGGMVMGGAVRPAMGASMGASARTNWGTSSSSAGGSSTGSDDSSSSSSNSSSDQGSQQVAPSGGSNQPNIIIVKQADTQSSGSPAAADADAGSSQP